MRDIKFRGKSLDGELVIGDLVTNYEDEPNAMYIVDEDSSYTEIDPLTVGQYTGINLGETELYEGMKLKYTYDDYEWNDEGVRSQVKKSTLSTIRMYNGSWCVMEDGHSYGEGMPTTLVRWIEDDDCELMMEAI